MTIMQDQAVAQSLSDTNEPTSMPHGAAPLPHTKTLLPV
ncbi:alkanesulfonate monooxygenase [Acetobacter orientalis]|uniref:Alkanesulfonate monooxygenase n=1 Tax=Acetobacter orientalis TaxID=146474 RepID=A0A2Z5ZH31_9PROT|nr:alkanesulfonate monooxygenase [Acetobacter orientalis]